MADNVLRGRKLTVTKLRESSGVWTARVSLGGAGRDVQRLGGVWQTARVERGETTMVPVLPEVAEVLQDHVKRAERRAAKESGREARQQPGLPPATPAGTTTTKETGMSSAATADKNEGTSAEKRTSLMAQVEAALRAADGPQTAGQLVESMGAEAFSAKAKADPFYQAYGRLSAGVKSGKFVKVDKGLFDLAELNPKGAKKRPAAKAA